MNATLLNSRDAELLGRARRVVPGGVWGHMATRAIAPGYPQFFARSEGCRVWDVDGNEYVDLMCAWGPNLLGYHHPVVDAAALEQMKMADIGNGPIEKMVELAELMVDTIDGADWAMAMAFSRQIALAMSRDAPNKYLAKMTKSARAGDILIDYLRNGRGATAIAAYSPRARPGAAVSTPVDWSELTAKLSPDRYTVLNLPSRLARLKSDPWAEIGQVRQQLPRTKAGD